MFPNINHETLIECPNFRHFNVSAPHRVSQTRDLLLRQDEPSSDLPFQRALSEVQEEGRRRLASSLAGHETCWGDRQGMRNGMTLIFKPSLVVSSEGIFWVHSHLSYLSHEQNKKHCVLLAAKMVQPESDSSSGSQPQVLRFPDTWKIPAKTC